MSRDDGTERASTSILALGVAIAATFLVAILAAVGSAYVAHAELQQAADIAATTIERAGGDAPRQRAEQLARANGASAVRFTTPRAAGHVEVEVGARAPRAFGVPIGSRIVATAIATMPEPTASLDAGPNPPGVYAGPLEPVDSATACPAVASAFRTMERAASRDGVDLHATSGFRGWAEQAVLYAALGPGLAAAPGSSRHHDATELDIAVGPAGSPTHRWLATHGPSHGFVQRYSWEPWHWGFVAGC